MQTINSENGELTNNTSNPEISLYIILANIQLLGCSMSTENNVISLFCLYIQKEERQKKKEQHTFLHTTARLHKMFKSSHISSCPYWLFAASKLGDSLHEKPSNLLEKDSLLVKTHIICTLCSCIVNNKKFSAYFI